MGNSYTALSTQDHQDILLNGGEKGGSEISWYHYFILSYSQYRSVIVTEKMQFFPNQPPRFETNIQRLCIRLHLSKFDVVSHSKWTNLASDDVIHSEFVLLPHSSCGNHRWNDPHITRWDNLIVHRHSSMEWPLLQQLSSMTSSLFNILFRVISAAWLHNDREL